MKRRIFLIAPLALLFVFSSCEKCYTECDLVPAKIIRYDCDRVIFQLLTTQTIGDADWLDVQTGERYSNVVSYYDNCKINKLTKGEMVSIYVRLKMAEPNPPIPDCYRCEALSQAPPVIQVDLLEVSKNPYDETDIK